MLKRSCESVPLTPWLRSLLLTRLFYRITAFDIFLPGLVVAGISGLVLHRWLAGSSEVADRIVFLGSFFLFIAVVNRAAWLLSGRGRVLAQRVRYGIERLLVSGRLDVLEFCSLTRVPYAVFAEQLDRVMAEEYHLGYLDREEMVIVLSDQPVTGKCCPACGAILSDTMVMEKVCGLCGSIYYI